MADLSALSTATTSATALSNLILVSPQKTIGYQPQNPTLPDGTPSGAQQPPAFLFDYEGEQSVNLESDITDHYIEDNTAIQDQISLKPVIVNSHGFIGELNDVAPVGLQTLKLIADKLVTIGAYTPSLSITAQVAYDNAFQLYQVAQNAANAAIASWSSLNGTGGENVIDGENILGKVGTQNSFLKSQNKQQTAFQLFYGYWTARTLFTVQTPWAVFENMALKTLRAVQDPETKVVTDFEVSFKQIRTAKTYGSTPLSDVSQGRLINQSSLVTDLGTSTPPPAMSLSSGLGSSYGSLFAGGV